MKIYLSSTYIDLKRHRATLARALRKAGYEVVMMEEYVARDQRVEFACQGDVVACDVYVGIFAWRYGHIPDDANPKCLSVTEMEYAAAGAKPMSRLTFLLKDEARWPKARKDADPARINDLRTRLKKRCSGYFANADQLAVEVLAAMRIEESTRLTQQLEAIDVMLKAQEYGPSYMMNIKDNLELLGQVPFVELQIGPTPWWNTRLYLVAALARDFGKTSGFVFVESDGKFLLTAPPSEICYRMELRWPAVKDAYANFLRIAPTLEKIDSEIWQYPQFVAEAFGEDEQVVKHCLSARDIDYELGIARGAEVVEVSEKGQRFLQREVLGRQTRFVALVRGQRLEGLVDREQLAKRVAQAALLQLA
ncbi:MAG: hypothetical protein CV087_21695 [Candidatus Brocadia sp. WS118]|nr:MAG: hypothetical protein CV087_21695 [Candidatus Brocadia sp. WS118]